MSETLSAPETVRVNLGARSYDILVGHGALSELGGRLLPLLKRKRVFVLTDETVARLHMDALKAALRPSGIETDVMALAPGEQSKSFSNLEGILDWLLGAGADRSDVLIAFGGGVIGDIAGLSASLMKRGMSFHSGLTRSSRPWRHPAGPRPRSWQRMKRKAASVPC